MASTVANCITATVLRMIDAYGGVSVFESKGEHNTMLMNSDSAKPLAKTFRQFWAILQVFNKRRGAPYNSAIRGQCGAHQLVIGLVDLLSLNKLVNGTFCTLTQLSKSANVQRVKSNMYNILTREVNIDHKAAMTNEGMAYSRALVYLLHRGDAGFFIDGAGNEAKAALTFPWTRVLELLPDWMSSGILS